MRHLAVLLLAATATLGVTACEDDPLEPDLVLDEALFHEFDADADGLLAEDEFFLGFQNEDVFGALDADADGFLDEDEFDDDLGAFDDFDADADTFLNEDEFLTGTFGVFDADDDFFVDEDEFGFGVGLF